MVNGQWTVAMGVWLTLVSGGQSYAGGVEVSLSPRMMVGKGLPSLQVYLRESVAMLTLRLTRSDGLKRNFRKKGWAGTSLKFELPQPEGHFTYTGELVTHFANGEESAMPLQFETELLGPLMLQLSNQSLDLADRKVTFTLSRPAAKVHLTVLMDTGKTIADEDVVFKAEPAGSPLEVTWPDAPGRVMKIALKAYDTSAFFTSLELLPWNISIPHDEINFDVGMSVIRDSEKIKLEQSHRMIQEALHHYGNFASLQLYVAGHTDTTGDPDANRKLSLGRAKTIALHFKKRGIVVPIFYQGFGQDAPLVAIPQATDEPRNRRAEYILSLSPPALKNTTLQPKWIKL